jgi:protein required for attachment to host cells
MKLWILIADEGRARLFASAGRGREVKEVKGFVHPAARQEDGDLVTDRPGRARAGLAGRAVTALSPHSDPKEIEAERFAAELAGSLGRARERKEFEGLMLVAPPHFLGLLRAHLDEQTRQTVLASAHKDLTLVAPCELAPHLSEVFAAAARTGSR